MTLLRGISVPGSVALLFVVAGCADNPSTNTPEGPLVSMVGGGSMALSRPSDVENEWQGSFGSIFLCTIPTGERVTIDNIVGHVKVGGADPIYWLRRVGKGSG